jgi:hypothetical protein
LKSNFSAQAEQLLASKVKFLIQTLAIVDAEQSEDARQTKFSQIRHANAKEFLAEILVEIPQFLSKI